jgi:UDP-N-acetylglucosamine--N-acetylmuramyl-(pentapeptide) pyrophosphoryl-undecaprenol N-acetylglucosamine transferase
MRVMIAGGGTGGHVYPGIAMCNALKRASEGIEALFVGAKAGVESRIFTELGLPHVLLPGRGIRGTGFLNQLSSPFVFLVGILRGIRVVRAFDADVVVGTGGYASVAVVAAAVVCRRPRVLQEQNSVPGMANRVLSRFADLVLLSYEESKAFFKPGVRVAVVGNPIRVDRRANRRAGLEFFGLEPGRPTVLICGGSRGARSINRAAREAIPAILAQRSAQFVFLTGQDDFEAARADLERLGSGVRVLPFLQEMHHAYSVADIAVSRSGASAVFELAAFGVPTVFVPYPFAADDHQKKNVATLAADGSAIVMENSALDGKSLVAAIESLLDDEDRRRRMSSGMKAWARPDADDRAAERILELAAQRVRAAAGPDRASPRKTA